ncbi:MAG: hypothetical protein M5U12_20000 [Verrucomicrobia bacterium]|nr:hypothetical protein [Verrucomicrobiota bacterium]
MVPPGVPVPPGTLTPADPAEGIQIAFQGARVDMIVQWLAQNTGKTVVKHPRVQCQLTIVSSKKVSVREALELVYRALALEGFNVIETRNSILLVPEGQDLKLSPEILTAASADIPEGRQRIMKIFPTTHVPAAELRDKIRGLLSERGTAEADERAGTLIVTDFNENLRLVAELLAEFDVVSVGDTTVEIFPIKHAEVDELANLIGLILNAQTGSGSGASAAAIRAASPMPIGGPPGMPGMPSGGPSPSPSPGPSASPTPSGAALPRSVSGPTAPPIVSSWPPPFPHRRRPPPGRTPRHRPPRRRHRACPPAQTRGRRGSGQGGPTPLPEAERAQPEGNPSKSPPTNARTPSSSFRANPATNSSASSSPPSTPPMPRRR